MRGHAIVLRVILSYGIGWFDYVCHRILAVYGSKPSLSRAGGPGGDFDICGLVSPSAERVIRPHMLLFARCVWVFRRGVSTMTAGRSHYFI